MPPLDQVLVPDFGWYNVVEPDGSRVKRNLLVEDAVRGYNGWPPSTSNYPGQFGLRWHEFWLKTQTVDIPNVGTRVILVVENERRDASDRLVADAIWQRIPANKRPPVGDTNYVEHVRSKDPTCP
ncbi:hypothetical protein D6833_05390 [Candidatus Parcubacteria bacterium]|nr:MAG: hypothetical protein D6833_05390 [Candidatus Parcubacteria bacterium]